MHCQWRGGSLRGIEGVPVRVEVQMARGLPGLSLVGLAGAATRESRERVLGALRESGFQAPSGRVTVNLAPAEEPKEGSAFDLPMALGLLEVTGQLRPRRGRGWWLLGELALDGRLRPVRGALALGLAARRAGAAGLILPAGNAAEAALLDGIPVGLLENLAEAVAWVEERHEAAPPPDPGEDGPARRRAPLDLAEVVGLPRVRRALEVAAAGGHNLLLVGSPGNGKSLMSRVLADLLPPLARDERREVMALRSVAGLDPTDPRRPFRAPHHTVSVAGFLGTASRGGRPGEIVLAHCGLLFLDELPEFNRAVREALREPLEDGRLVLSRGAGRLVWPARFQLVAAMNPCPCGQALRGEEHCRCSPAQVRAYLGRISGPLLDRIDLVVEVPRWRASEGAPRAGAAAGGGGVDGAAGRDSGGTDAARARVLAAWRRLRAGEVAAEPEGGSWLDAQLERAGASFRARGKVRGVARTLAALDGRDRAGRGDLVEALDLCLGLRRRLEPGLAIVASPQGH
ncbi:MAG: YifB family Mg chelatase-like AAA ATPase [Candidatus Krumholzibacteriota bacterium]|nr:YifB family Mg chelatase-like AAA ATPase [Candidatus Krumholzibacteriota bacterium]